MAGPTLAEVENESAADTMRAVLAESGGKLETGNALEGAIDDGPAKSDDVSGTKPAGSGKAERGTDRPAESAASGTGRDEKGRFVPKDGADGAAKPADDRDTAIAIDDAAPAEGDDVALDPPTDWPVERQESFRKADPEIRQFMLEQDTAVRRSIDEANNYIARYRGIDEVLAPRREAFARDGMSEAQAVKQIFALSDMALRQPIEFAHWFLRQRGLTPQALLPQGGQQPGAEPEYTDPELQRLSTINSQLQERLDRLEGTFQSQAEQSKTAQQQQIRTEIQQFEAARDDKGRPLRPYINEVRSLMGAFIGSGTTSDLSKAYDMACRAHPEVYAKIVAAERANAEREQAKQRRDKAAAAGNAGKSISGQPTDRSRPEPTGDLREDMRREFAERGLLS